MDYGAQPPEVNSGRMYAGPGSGPLMAAAAAWQALAAELGVAATSFDAVVDTLATGPWLGPSSAAMMSAAMPYVTFLLTHAMQAEQHAIAATSSAASFDRAFATVITPAQIAENRTELATLIATNFMGVNTPAIAANEAEYSEFWAQDAATLYGYAGEESATAASMLPFMPSDVAADPAAVAGQAAAVGGQTAGTAGSTVGDTMGQMGGMGSSMGSLMSAPMQAAQAFPQALQSLAQGGQGFSGILGSLGQFMNPSMFGALSSMTSPSSSLASMSNLGGGARVPSGVSASMGRGMGLPSVAGMSDGGRTPRLSVPASWTGSVERESVIASRGVTALSEEETPVAAAAPRGAMMPAMMGGNSSAGQGPAENRRLLSRPRVVVNWP